MKNHIFTICLMAAFAISCSIQEMDQKNGSGLSGQVFYARMEEPVDDIHTKVFVDDNLMVLWHAEDRVSIFNKYTFNQEYRFTGSTGANSGSFKKVQNDDFVTGNALDLVYALYPFRESTVISNRGLITVDIPANQSYVKDSFGPGANAMVSCTESNDLLFKNLCGYLMLRLYGENVSVTSIEFKGNNDEPLAGPASVYASVDSAPNLEFASDASKEITLTFDSPVTIGATSETATTFWIVVPPTTFNKGFTLTVKDNDSRVFEKTTSKSFIVERNSLARMTALRVEPVAPSVAVESIVLNKTSLTLSIDESEVLVAAVHPDDATDKTVKWSSSNNSIATVENGKVTALQEGTATITASAGDKTATCKVTVNKKAIPVESVSLDKTDIRLTEGESEKLTATINPDDATDKSIVWTSSNTNVATVENGLVKAVKYGKANITASVGEKTASCSILVVKDSPDAVYATYAGGAITIINGIIQRGSQLIFGVTNYSSETIKVSFVQLINGNTGAEGDVYSIGAEINPGESSSWTITIGLAGIQEPIARFTYSFKGKQYTCEAKYQSWHWGF